MGWRPASTHKPPSAAGFVQQLINSAGNKSPWRNLDFTVSKVHTGLSPAIDKLLNKSPTLKAEIKAMQKQGWKIEYGNAGEGTYTLRDTKTIVIDSDLRDTEDTVAILAHEAGHAMYAYQADWSSKDKFVMGSLRDEAAAAMNNITVQREILAAGGADIGLPSTQGPLFNKIYDKYIADGNFNAARDAIANAYGQNEFPSTAPDKNYATYYGDWYDQYAV